MLTMNRRIDFFLHGFFRHFFPFPKLKTSSAKILFLMGRKPLTVALADRHRFFQSEEAASRQDGDFSGSRSRAEGKPFLWSGCLPLDWLRRPRLPSLVRDRLRLFHDEDAEFPLFSSLLIRPFFLPANPLFFSPDRFAARAHPRAARPDNHPPCGKPFPTLFFNKTASRCARTAAAPFFLVGILLSSRTVAFLGPTNHPWFP